MSRDLPGNLEWPVLDSRVFTGEDLNAYFDNVDGLHLTSVNQLFTYEAGSYHARDSSDEEVLECAEAANSRLGGGLLSKGHR